MEKADNATIEETKKFSILIDIYNYKELIVEYFGGDVDDEYAYYIYCDDKIVKKFGYSHNNQCSWWMENEGTYKVKIFVKDKNGNKRSVYSECVEYCGKNIIREINTEKTIVQKILLVIKEIVTNWSMMVRVALFDYKLQNKDSYLGVLWELLNPLIQIGTYWIVFGFGLRQGRDVNGYPYLLWMLSGLIPWFCISAAIIKGGNSIFSKAVTITKLRYPIATVPIGAILTELFGFFFMMIVLEMIFIAYGYFPGWSYLNLIYYILYMFLFLASLALVTSVFTMAARDFQKLLSNLIRLLFYLTPILWDMDKMPTIYQNLISLVPIYYIVRGFRESLLYGVPFYVHRKDMIVSWSIVIVLFIFGCYLQDKFRNRFRDLI